MNPIEVTLGNHTVQVYPQRHAYLTNRLGRWYTQLVTGEIAVDSDNILSMLGDQAYEVLTALIPTLGKRMTLWEFMGYASEAAMAAGEYVEEEDASPTVPEIVAAFNTAIAVNRFDLAKVLTKLVDPNLLRRWVNARVAEQILKASPNSLPMNGASDQMSSGTTAPTSTENAA